MGIKVHNLCFAIIERTDEIYSDTVVRQQPNGGLMIEQGGDKISIDPDEIKPLLAVLTEYAA